MLITLKKILGILLRGILGYIQNHFEIYPKLPTPSFVIGYSNEKQPINCHEIGNGKISVLFIFGIHGNEVGTIKLSHHFINWCYTHEAELRSYSLYIIPCLNPDGYTTALQQPDYWHGGRIGRFNKNKVDLNRNFPTASFVEQSTWSFGKNYSKKQTVFCGSSAGSEPEIQALIKFIRDKKISTLFSYHNTAGDVTNSQSPLAQKLAQCYASLTNFKYMNHEEWKKLNQTGTAKEWCEENTINFVEIESSVRWGSDWKRQKPAMLKMLELLQ